jgi:hypothetical protein
MAKIGFPPNAVKKSPRYKPGITQTIEYADHYEELLEAERHSFGFRQLLNPDLLGDGAAYTDPNTGITGKARISEVRWLERGIVRAHGGALKESVRRVRVKPIDLINIDGIYKARLQESVSPRKYNRLKENTFFDMGLDQNPQSAASMAGIYLPIPPGPYTKQLYLSARWQMKAKCFEARNHDPILHGAVAILSAFVIGKGVSLDFEDERSQAIWDEFEERVELQRRLPIHSDMLSTDGDLFWRLPEITVGGMPGFADLIAMESGTIWEKITDPEDIRIIYGYWRQFSTAYQLYTVGNVPMIEYIIDIVPAEEVIHLTINCQEGEKFGRSDLLAALSTSAMLRDIMKYRSIRVLNESALCIDHTIKGDNTDITTVLNNKNSMLGPGTETWHNESEKIDFHQWQGSGTPKSGLHDEMLAHIGQGVGEPKEYLGGGDQSSRAAALASTEPAAKLFGRRQTEFEYGLKQIANRVMMIAKKYGRLAPDADAKCECTFPVLVEENKKEKLDRIVLCQTSGFFSKERCAEMAANNEDVTSFDYQTEKATIDADKLNDPIVKAMYAQPGVPPTPGQPALPPAAGAPPVPRGGAPIGSALSSQMRRDTTTALQTREAKKFTLKSAKYESEVMKRSGFRLLETDAKIPKGWGGAIEKMAGKTGSEPITLAYWMESQGYSPK